MVAAEVCCAYPSCKNTFRPPACAPKKKFCSPECRKKARNLSRRAPPVEKATCHICGERFVPDKFHRHRQRCCLNPACQRLRNQLLQSDWYKRNRDLFRAEHVVVPRLDTMHSEQDRDVGQELEWHPKTGQTSSLEWPGSGRKPASLRHFSKSALPPLKPASGTLSWSAEGW